MGAWAEFYKNMWIMRRIDEAFLKSKVTAGKITQDEYNIIVATQQVTTD